MPLRGPDPEHFLVSIEEAVRVLAELIETSPVMSVRSVADHLGACGALLPNDAVPHHLPADLVRCNVVRRLFEFIDVGPWSCRSLQAFFKISSRTGTVLQGIRAARRASGAGHIPSGVLNRTMSVSIGHCAYDASRYSTDVSESFVTGRSTNFFESLNKSLERITPHRVLPPNHRAPANSCENATHVVPSASSRFDPQPLGIPPES